MSITSRWQMDAEIDTELKKKDKSITSRWQMDAEIDTELKKEKPKAFEKRCVFSKEDDVDYLTNSDPYDHNNRDF